MTNEVIIEDTLGVRVITINRPNRRNAFNGSAYRGVAEAVSSADAHPEIRATIITGAGGHFSAGNDLADFVAPKTEESGGAAILLEALIQSRKPLFAAVEGYAVGIGVTMLLHCDMVYAGQSAKFKLPFVPMGVVPEGGSSYLLPKSAGIKKATEILLFGETFSSAVAEDVGIITSVVEDGTALEYATERANQIAKLPTEALQSAKQLIRAADRETLAHVVPIEFAEFARRLQSDETQAIIKSMMAR